MLSSWCNFRAHQTYFQSHDVKTFIFGQTPITYSVVISKTTVKSKVILDIIFKGLIHKGDAGHNKMGEKCL